VADVVARILPPRTAARSCAIRNPKSLGEDNTASARGTAASTSALYDDDVLLPGCLGAMADVLDRHPEVALAVARGQVIDADGVEIRARPRWPVRSRKTCASSADLTSFLADWSINFIGRPVP
jgi:hypothetical protein